jgi:hypothetical protein
LPHMFGLPGQLTHGCRMYLYSCGYICSCTAETHVEMQSELLQKSGRIRTAAGTSTPASPNKSRKHGQALLKGQHFCTMRLSAWSARMHLQSCGYVCSCDSCDADPPRWPASGRLRGGHSCAGARPSHGRWYCAPWAARRPYIRSATLSGSARCYTGCGSPPAGGTLESAAPCASASRPSSDWPPPMQCSWESQGDAGVMRGNNKEQLSGS